MEPAHRQLIAAALALMVLGQASAQGSWWVPPLGATWQYQLSDDGTIPVVPGVQVYVIDIDTARTALPELRAAVPDVRVVCYFSAGTWEKFRANSWDRDRGNYSISKGSWKGVRGNEMDYWPDERWLDIRSSRVRRIMTRRMKFAKLIGCNGIDPDNIDGYQADTGFNLTREDQLAFIRWLAQKAHSLGLGIGLKNSGDFVAEVHNDFDWFINESCFTFDECDVYDVVGAKNVWGVQYCDSSEELDYPTSDPACYCAKANAKGWQFTVKRVELGSEGITCADFCKQNKCEASEDCNTDEGNICAALLGKLGSS